MDTPQVAAAELADALSKLEAPGTGAVLGHAVDGGWWALGLQRPHAGVFANIPTSRPDTGSRQEARLGQLGLRVRRLPTRRDVDTWTDARAVAAEGGGTRFARAVTTLAGGVA